MNLQSINASASPEVQMNENFEALDWTAVYAKNALTSSGLTWGYLGGRWSGFAITAATLTLTDATTNYIVVARATGVASVSTATTNWNNTAAYARLYKVVTAGGAVSGTPEDHRAGEYGLGSGGAAFVDNETPSGTINGTDGTDGNATFTLAYAPSPAASLQLFKTDVGTGVLMISGVHYNLSGSTIVYTSGNIPIASPAQTHRAWYRK